MKTVLQIVRIFGVLTVTFLGWPSGAQTADSSTGIQSQAAAHPGIILRTSDVVNAKVFSQQGAEFGHIRDVLLDPKKGQISHAVVGIGGWQGIGERFAIVPWDFVVQDQQRAENYVIQADTEKLKNAPTFEKDQWSTAIQPDYLAKVQKYYTSPSPPQQTKSQPATPAASHESQIAQSGATPAKQAEERPRKKLQIQPRPPRISGDQERVGTESQSEKGGSDEGGK